MKVPPTVTLRGPAPLRARAAKYTMVSVVSVVVTQAVLLVAHGWLGWAATTANVAAVSAGCVPSYGLNRYWVWGKRGRNHLLREVLPFWAVALVGLLFSTALVALAARWWDSSLLVAGANLTAFGILWVLKFVLLDSLLFADR